MMRSAFLKSWMEAKLSKASVCVIDIGSPKLGNLGWCFVDGEHGHQESGENIDDTIPLIAGALETGAVLLGLEAPLFVPLREDLMLATKGRLGEGRRPWSAGAGAQVLAMNLPIMTRLFKKIYKAAPKAKPHLNAEHGFEMQPNNLLIFEALVSGADKGKSHVEDAHIMAKYCYKFLKQNKLPPSILEDEPDVEYLNLAGQSLLHCDWSRDFEILHQPSPIYKPSDLPF